MNIGLVLSLSSRSANGLRATILLPVLTRGGWCGGPDFRGEFRAPAPVSPAESQRTVGPRMVRHVHGLKFGLGLNGQHT